MNAFIQNNVTFPQYDLTTLNDLDYEEAKKLDQFLNLTHANQSRKILNIFKEYKPILVPVIEEKIQVPINSTIKITLKTQFIMNFGNYLHKVYKLSVFGKQYNNNDFDLIGVTESIKKLSANTGLVFRKEFNINNNYEKIRINIIQNETIVYESSFTVKELYNATISSFTQNKTLEQQLQFTKISP